MVAPDYRGSLMFSRDRHLANWAKLYSQQTPAEQALEPAIASMGLPYRCQHTVWAISAFADFALPSLRVIIEVDDKSHNQLAKRKKDAERTAKLNRLGWTVVRCTNEQALADPYETVNRLMSGLKLPHQTKQG